MLALRGGRTPLDISATHAPLTSTIVTVATLEAILDLDSGD